MIAMSIKSSNKKNKDNIAVPFINNLILYICKYTSVFRLLSIKIQT